MMDCGIPVKSAVSGIVMGLLLDENGYVVLSDIQGLEDHYGDMDFKVAGTNNGITALQLDIKVSGLSEDILRRNALAQAKQGRLHILDTMNDAIDQPRSQIAPNAPKIDFISIDPEKVGTLIGPGGKMIRRIEEETGAVVVEDGSTGHVSISAPNSTVLDHAKSMIDMLVREFKEGDNWWRQSCKDCKLRCLC